MRGIFGSVAVRRGLAIGAVLAVFAGAVTWLYDGGLLPDAAQAVEFLVLLVGFSVAGALAARVTGQTSSGAFAGLVASLLGGGVILGASVVWAIVAPGLFAGSVGYHQHVATIQLVGVALARSAAGLIMWAVLGGGLGALGGMMGKRSGEPKSSR
jgi:hypothetical protein